MLGAPSLSNWGDHSGVPRAGARTPPTQLGPLGAQRASDLGVANRPAVSYFSGMKMKTSITLSEDLVAAIDKLAGRRGRSAVVELALRAFLEERSRRVRNARDLATLNRHAKELNAEAIDTLAFQMLPDID